MGKETDCDRSPLSRLSFVAGLRVFDFFSFPSNGGLDPGDDVKPGFGERAGRQLPSSRVSSGFSVFIPFLYPSFELRQPPVDPLLEPTFFSPVFFSFGMGNVGSLLRPWAVSFHPPSFSLSLCLVSGLGFVQMVEKT